METKDTSSTAPLISVIVPVYNTEKYLAECLNSVISQSYRNIEIVVVDDASKDKSLSIIEDFAKRDKRISIYRHAVNRGLSEARNTGLQHAKGDYIAWCDSDDVMYTRFVEYLYSELKRSDADFAECQCIVGHEFSAALFADVVLENRTSIGDANDFLKRYATHELQTALWTKLFKKELFANFAFPRSRLYEDNYFYVHLYEHLNRGIYTSVPLYFYRKRESSIMNNFGIRELREGLKITDLFYEFSNRLEDEYKILFRKKTVKILLSYWQRIAGIRVPFSSKIKWLKIVNRRMAKAGVNTSDAMFFTRKERIIYLWHNSICAFRLYYLFRKQIKRNI